MTFLHNVFYLFRITDDSLHENVYQTKNYIDEKKTLMKNKV